MKTASSYSKSTTSPPKPRKKGRVLLRAELLEKHLPVVRVFDELPNSANVPNGAVAAWLGISMPTYWSWVRKGRLPQPHRADNGTRFSHTNVGEVRKSRAGGGA